MRAHRGHFVEVLFQPGQQIAVERTGVGRRLLGLQLLHRHVRQQLRQVAPAAIDGDRGHARARRHRRHRQPIAALFL